MALQRRVRIIMVWFVHAKPHQRICAAIAAVAAAGGTWVMQELGKM